MLEGYAEGGRRRGRTFEEIALLDAELAYAGAESEEGEAEDGAEQGHVGFGFWASLGCRDCCRDWSMLLPGAVVSRSVSRRWSRTDTLGLSTAVNRLTL
jgi:hypothetical protein